MAHIITDWTRPPNTHIYLLKTII